MKTGRNPSSPLHPQDRDASRLVETVVDLERSTGFGARRASGWRWTAKVLFSVAVLAMLAYVVDWPEFIRVARASRLEVLALAAALLVLGNVLIAWRWKLLLEPVGIHTTVRQALESYLKGHFLAHFVPSGVTADIVKAVDMNSAPTQGRTTKGMELASSIFVERGFGAITVAMAVVLGLIASPLVGEHADMQQLLGLSAGVIILCCLLALFADKLLDCVPKQLTLRRPRLGALLLRARDSIAAYRRSPGRLVGVMLLSVFIQALRILPVYVIAVAIGAGEAFFPFLIAVPIIFLSNMVPVIGSRIGTEQGLFVLLLGLAGVNPEAALVIALLSLALNLFAALPGGYWLINGRRPGQAKLAG